MRNRFLPVLLLVASTLPASAAIDTSTIEWRRGATRARVLQFAFLDCMRMTYASVDRPVHGVIVVSRAGVLRSISVDGINGPPVELQCPVDAALSKMILGTPEREVAEEGFVAESLCSRSLDDVELGCSLASAHEVMFLNGAIRHGSELLADTVDELKETGATWGDPNSGAGFLARIHEVDGMPPAAPKPAWQQNLLDAMNICLNRVMPVYAARGMAARVRVPEKGAPVVTDVLPREYSALMTGCLNARTHAQKGSSGELVAVQFDVDLTWGGKKKR